MTAPIYSGVQSDVNRTKEMQERDVKLISIKGYLKKQLVFRDMVCTILNQGTI